MNEYANAKTDPLGFAKDERDKKNKKTSQSQTNNRRHMEEE